jgi:hypothetical protein
MSHRFADVRKAKKSVATGTAKLKWDMKAK